MRCDKHLWNYEFLIDIKPSPEIINRIDTNHASVYLQYFYYKYSKNLSLPDLIHYLKTKVLDELKKNGNQLKISVFKSQWNLLISENTKKYYKDYYRFIKNFEWFYKNIKENGEILRNSSISRYLFLLC